VQPRRLVQFLSCKPIRLTGYYTAFCKTDDYGAQVGSSDPNAVRDLALSIFFSFLYTFCIVHAEHHGDFLLNTGSKQVTALSQCIILGKVDTINSAVVSEIAVQKFDKCSSRSCQYKLNVPDCQVFILRNKSIFESVFSCPVKRECVL